MVNVLAQDSFIEETASMFEILEMLFGIVVIFVFALIAYLSVHIAEEQKQGKIIPLPWERKPSNKLFDKSHVQYRDGDNT